MSVRSWIGGVVHTIRAGQKRSDETAYGLARGVVKAARFLLDESRKIVPVDTFLLHNTSRVEESGRGATKVADVTYNQPYALIQHENPNYKHKPGRRYKYLEGPARIHRGRMRQIIRDEAKKR